MSSSMNSSEFLAKNSNFVLKLRLVGVGGTPQIRRVKLDRIAGSGAISYLALLTLAIEYTFPGAPIVLEDYDVALTYYDVDNDCITIASTEELVDAIDQFSSMSPPVLRLTTDVKRKKSVRSPPASPRRGAHASPGRNAQRQRGSNSGRQATQQLQTLIESFVGILATAMVALQAHMNPEPSSRSNTNGIASGSTTPTSVASATATSTEVPNGPDAVESGTSTATATPTPPPDLPRKLEEAKTFVKDFVEKMKVEKEPEEDVSERPFIHGRHTCDACLVTPIVGVRYHAINLPDYDLCSNCLGNYKGTEIKFEPAELDRDRPFQDRWHRRRARWAGGRGHCRPKRHLNRGAAARADNMDAALKEAICRSLRDANLPAKEPAKTESKKDVASDDEVKPPATEKPCNDKSLPAKEFVSAHPDEGETTGPCAEELKGAKTAEQPTTEDDKDESFTSAAAGNGSTAEAIGQTLDKCADVIDAMMTELSREMTSDESEAKSKNEEKATTAEDANEVAEDISAMTSSVPSLMSIVEPEATTDSILEPSAGCEDPPAVGATIVEATVAEQDAGSQSSEDEWQVVTDDAQIAGDEALARAFELIGSALFQSDVNAASEGAEGSVGNSNNSTSSGSSTGSTVDVSAATSVPSTVPSIAVSTSVVPLAVQARWATQLEKLRELGFDDEAACVEVLERLHAANMGSGEDEEVNVTQVVNVMLQTK